MKKVHLTYLTMFTTLGLYAACYTNIDHELYRAAQTGDASKVEHLLKRGANPNKRHLTWDPWDIAVKNAHPDVVKKLLENNTDPQRIQKIGTFTISLMISRSPNALVDVPLANVIETLKLLVDNGFDVNKKTVSTEDTPLISVARDNTISNKRAFPIIKTLIDAGAKKDIVNNRNNSAVEEGLLHAEIHEARSRKDADKLKSRALFIEAYPGDTLQKKIILDLVLKYYSEDETESNNVKEAIKPLPDNLQDRIKDYLHNIEIAPLHSSSRR